MGIWDWALEAYAQPGVPEACLALQDAHGQNTSLLLWAVYAEVKDPVVLETLEGLAKGRGGARALEALEAASQAWEKPAPAEALAELAAALDHSSLRLDQSQDDEWPISKQRS